MEYAGYIPVKGIDISGLTGKIADKVFTIGEEREAKRQELDDLAQEAKKGMFIPMTDNNALNKKIEGLTGTSTDLLYGLNKDLRSGKKTPSEYKRAVNSLLANVDNMKKMADQYDKRIESAADRIDKGEAGALQAEQIRFMDETLNLNNDWGIDEDTFDMYMLTKDGRKVYADWINKDGNLTSRKIDLSKKAKDNMAGWSAESFRESYGIGGAITHESLRANKSFAAEVESFAYAMTQGDNLQSVLLDNGGLKGSPLFIYSKDQAKSVIQEEVDKFYQINGIEPNEEELESIENRVVFMDQNGKPQFTEKQIEIAKERARDEIYIRAAEISNLDVQRGFSQNKGRGSGTQSQYQKQRESGAIYKAAVRAFQSDPDDESAMADLNKFAADRGKQAGVEYKFEKEKQPNPIDGEYGIIVTTYKEVLEMPSRSSEEFLNSPEYKEAVEKGKQKKTVDGQEVERTDRDKQTLIDGAYSRFSKDESNKIFVPKQQGEPQRLDKTSQLMQYLGSKKPFSDFDTGLRLYPDYESDYKRYMSEYYYPTKNSGGKPKSFEEWRKGGTTQGTTTNNNSSTVNVTSGSPI